MVTDAGLSAIGIETLVVKTVVSIRARATESQAPKVPVAHRCHILETGNDSFRFKASSAVATRKRKETTPPLTQA